MQQYSGADGKIIRQRVEETSIILGRFRERRTCAESALPESDEKTSF